ncbi:DNA-3-methyladenine glycosylase I [Kocuria rosea]|uniref:DNA-3-methyladenine glycosylase I n=1 Tax=Kocuria rosea TaxID=1275 RepID=UPI002541D0AF|nr:DNA-3-methyladenine glycosylase I [Kocuria rosea]WIG17978.1 DNA-3-methyladenine glycosylase I [Kocuria rosea]
MDTASAGHDPHPADDRSRPGTDARPPDAHRSRGAHDRPGDRPPDTALRDGGARSPDDAFRAVLCGDGLRRCPWAPTGRAALGEHDRRWGARPTDSSGWFEALSLEIFQAGLARWSIAQRREGLRRALRGFVPEEIARMTEDDVDELLLDPAVIRNRVKIEAVVHNARACRGLGPEDWAEHVADLRPGAAEPPLTVLEESRRSPEGDRLAARLKEQGLVFVGRTTAHRFLLRTGVLPGHLAGCFRGGTGTGGSG